MLSLTTTTCGAAAESIAVMPRPRRIGTPNVSKKSGPTVFTCSTPSSGDANVTPGMANSLPSSLVPSGGLVENVRALHAWQRPQPLQRLPVHLGQPLTFEARAIGIDRHREHAVGDEPEWLRPQVAERGQQQHRRHHEHRRQRHLDDDEQPECAAAHRDRASAGRECVAHVQHGA